MIPLDVNPAMNGMFIAEPFNAVRTMANLFSTHPPIEQRLMNLIGRESTGTFRGPTGGLFGGRPAYRF